MNIQTLDHAAIRVHDLEKSAQWYSEVLRLERVQPKEWGAFPIFMVCENGTGVALFPLPNNQEISGPKTDHIAFRLDNQSFLWYQEHLQKLGVHFQFQDHHFFHSIYFKDPDEYQLELTTQVKPL